MGVQGGGSNGGGDFPGPSQTDSHGEDLHPPESKNGVASAHYPDYHELNASYRHACARTGEEDTGGNDV
jgi:hypothetical protein